MNDNTIYTRDTAINTEMVIYAEHRKFDLTESKMAMTNIQNSVPVILNQVNNSVYLIFTK